MYIMDSLLLQEATANFNTLINQVTQSHKPVIVKGTDNDVVIISKEDWAAIKETTYLNSIQGYIDSLKEVRSSPRSEWVKAEELGL
jgi:prevent-host-death family protein